MANKYRWVLKNCGCCERQYADHERYVETFKQWYPRSEYCTECLMNGDLEQRQKAVAAARARWQKRLVGEIAARARLLKTNQV